MQIIKDESKGDGIVILRLDGRLDAISSPKLDDEIENLLNNHKLKLIIDFSGVDYLSSAGMRALLSGTKKVSKKGGKLSTHSMNEDLMEIIKMAGFGAILTICLTEDEAIKSLNQNRA